MSGDLDVLIVGAGPTGLFTACELLRRGVSVRLVDRAPQAATVPKALALWPRALDLLTDLGVGDAVRRAGVPVRGFSYFSDGRPLASYPIPEGLRPLHLPQYETERVLTERLHSLGGKIERGVRLLTFDDVDFSGRIDATDGVTAVLEHGDAGVRRQRASYVIGADGAASTVRGALGIGFQGSTYELSFALIDTHVSGHLPPDQLLYYQAPTGTLMIAPLPDGMFRILSVMPRQGAEVSAPMMQRLLDERGPGGVTITDPVWQTVYRVHARTATEYQRGRVFLAGDAAHVHSPAGGQGMNNGLQDGYNLAWKLAAVLSGASPSSLLADYGRERAEATDRIVADTDRQTRAWMAGSRARIVARDAAFKLAGRTGVVPRFVFPVMAGRRVRYSPTRPTQVPAGRTRCRLLRGVPGRLRDGMVFPRELAVACGFAGPNAGIPEWTVVVLPAAHHGDLADRVERVTARWPGLRHVRLRRSEAAVTGCLAPGFYLIRPDGHIAAHGHEADVRHLGAELERVLTPTDGRQP
ncbi:FAD-dependent oxidoreductase [Streptomyces litchfieldiae]|uniref:FAD-dependent oxidoreductase n=1 Tax=Streptomyces litchfieldiae TaxID=3075543 RepID=A0ABU2MWQ8_9ACTN|nr:FAD-dependent oxidoreductase [Streptomyces sp. DSM 44938]MDT0345807.1 FAD-dependent oxidoreductase [Streptomyces sp. DSM 44938]